MDANSCVPAANGDRLRISPKVRQWCSPVAAACRPAPTRPKPLPENIWATLDKVHDNVPDMVLVHGGDTKGADRLAASWAERRGIQQLAFSLNRSLGARAGFTRNAQDAVAPARVTSSHFPAPVFSNGSSSRPRLAGLPWSIAVVR